MSNPDWRQMFGPIDVSSIPSSAESPPTDQSPTLDSPPQQVAPGVFDMAASFVGSMAQFAAGGFRAVSKEVHEQRLATCQACEHFARGNCLICGCFIAPKTAMPHEACPLAKWRSAT